MTWVATDYTATPGTNEVSVTKGQQVEIIETACNGAPEFCLVRLNIHSGSAVDGSGTIEGIVPMSVLKLAPSNKSVHRKGGDTSTNDNKDSNDTNGKCTQLINFFVRFFFIFLLFVAFSCRCMHVCLIFVWCHLFLVENYIHSIRFIHTRLWLSTFHLKLESVKIVLRFHFKVIAKRNEMHTYT